MELISKVLGAEPDHLIGIRQLYIQSQHSFSEKEKGQSGNISALSSLVGKLDNCGTSLKKWLEIRTSTIVIETDANKGSGF